MTIKTCFFDMGNVLVYFSHDLMYQNVALLTGLSAVEVKRIFVDEGQLAALETGTITAQQLCETVSLASGASLQTEELCEAMSAIFCLNESIIPLLEELRATGKRLVLLSNTSRPHLEYVQRNYTFLTLFDDMVTSFAAGAMKPSPAIFEAALRKANCSASECFYTDDIEQYIQQAESMGIHSLTYTDTPALREKLQQLDAFQPA